MNEDFFALLHQSRILVVDDDEDFCQLLTKRFGVDEYANVEYVLNGADAMAQMTKAVVDRKPYSLVLLDLMLPGKVSGKSVYQGICDTLDVPVVVVSALDAKEEIRDALKTGTVEEYFVKPIDIEVLFLKCERILTRRLFGRQLHQSARRNQMLFLNILQVMAKVLEAKDPYTKFHSENVAKYARQIAKRLDYTDSQLELIQIAGILHDFGKIGIKEGVLNKPGALTDYEYETVKRHPLIASAILEPIEELRMIIRDIRHHHEWWNGQGYPDGLVGDDIPLGARILTVADAYDAMTSSRSYHDPMDEAEAQEELKRCAGVQFDEKVVNVFLEVLQENQNRRERIIKLRERYG